MTEIISELTASIDPRITRFATPLIDSDKKLTSKAKIEKITYHMEQVLTTLGLDLQDPSLKDTPERIAKMYVNEVFYGLNTDNFPRISFFENNCHAEQNGSFVHVKTSICSFCEHHFVPIIGTAHIAYVPREKLIGLSKIPRIADFFAKQPQLQERLTAQIADSLSKLLETDDVAVWIKAQHHCVTCRGVEDSSNATITQVLLGEFFGNQGLRTQFIQQAIEDS